MGAPSVNPKLTDSQHGPLIYQNSFIVVTQLNLFATTGGSPKGRPQLTLVTYTWGNMTCRMFSMNREDT